MAKGPTKAQQALTEAREWIAAAKEEVRERETALLEARKQLEMHETIYAVLEKTLTRAPKKAVTKTAVKKTSTGGNSRRGLPLMCAYIFPDDGRPYAGHTCTAEKDGPIHDPAAGYAGYHPFQPPASARRSSKSARAVVEGSSANDVATKAQAKEAGFIAVSSGTETGAVSDVAHAASGE